MRLKLTFLLLALNAALLAVLLYFEKAHSTRHLFDDAARLVLDPDFVHALDRIRILPAAGGAWELEREDNQWRVSSPLKWRANPYAVNQLLFQLRHLAWDSRFPVSDLSPSGQTLASYNLADPPIRLELQQGARSITLSLGSPTDIGNRLYLMTSGGEFIHVVSRSLLEALQRDPRALLDRRIFSPLIQESRAVQIQDRAASNVRVRLQRRGEAWQFVSPIDAPADRDRVEALIAQWQFMEVEDFNESPSADLPEDGNGSALRLTFEGLSQRETLILTPVPADAADPVHYLGRREAWPATFRVAAGPVRELRRVQEELRQRRVLQEHGAGWNSLEIQFGSLSTTLQQLENGSWQVLYTDPDGGLRSLPAEPQAIKRMQELLANLEAERFVSDAPSEADLARFGLTEPQRRVILRKDASASVEFRLGGLYPDTGKTLLYAVTNQSSSVFLLPPHVLAALPLDPLQYRERTVRSLPDSATFLEIALIDRETATPLYSSNQPDGLPPADAAALQAYLHTVRVDTFVSRPFADPWPLDRDRQIDWPYLLQARIRFASDPPDSHQTLTLYISGRLSGNTQYVGDPVSGLVGFLPGEMIELLDPLLARLPEAPPQPAPPAELPAPEPATGA